MSPFRMFFLVWWKHVVWLFAFSAFTLLVGRQEEHLACKKIEWWGVGVVVWLERGADCLRMMMPLPLHPKNPSSVASFKSRLVLPFWYRLTQVDQEKRPSKWCSSSSSWSVTAPCSAGFFRRTHLEVYSRFLMLLIGAQFSFLFLLAKDELPPPPSCLFLSSPFPSSPFEVGP